MKKLKQFIIFSIIILIVINNLFIFILANKYKNIDKFIKPTIKVRINKYGNTEGISFNPMLIFSKNLQTKVQSDFRKIYIFLNMIIIMVIIYKRKELSYYGTAKFANKEDIKKMNIIHHENDGVVLGMTKNSEIITHTGPEHILNMAPTRTGKGINTVLPTLWTWKDSVIINDIKGECWDLTSGFRRKELGQKCLFFNPMDESGESISYNPLDLVRVGTRSEQEDARAIAITLLDTDGKGESDHWISSAINLLTAVILHVKYVNKNASFIDVMRFLEDPKEPLVDKLGAIVAKELNEFGDVVDKVLKDEEGNPVEKLDPFNHFEALKKQVGNNMSFYDLYMKNGTLHPIVGSTFATMFATPDKERGSIFSTCINKLGIFKDPRVMRNIMKSEVSPKDLKKEGISLYLITPPKAIQMTKPLFRLIITQTIYELTDKMEFNNRKKIDKEKKKRIFKFNLKQMISNFLYKNNNKNLKTNKSKKILFLIDEFPSLGNLGLFELALAYIAGYGLKALLIVQSINQLNKIYGKNNSIVDNCSVQLYFTPNDVETPKMISDMMGNRTERIITRSGRGFMMENRSETFQARPLMTQAEVRVLPYESILLLLSGKNPILGKKIFWYKHKKYKNNADYNIPYPSYLELLNKIEEEGADEYILEYLIYLKKSYKVLKILISNIGLENFVKKILNSKTLNEWINKIISLSEKEKENLKREILTTNLNKTYKLNKKFESKVEEYLKNFSNDDLIKYFKKKYYREISREYLENLLEKNLQKIENDISKKEYIKIQIINHLKEKKVRDSWIFEIPIKFVELLLELENKNKNILEETMEIIDEHLEIEDDVVINFDYDFIEVQEILIERYRNDIKVNAEEI